MKENKFLLVIAGIVTGFVQISIVIAMLVLPSLISNSTPVSSFSENGLKRESSLNEKSSTERNAIFKKRQEDKNGSSKEIIIYNGITIDEGVKSNSDINSKAVQLTKKAKSDREKAKILYSWVGSNIKYDDDKATKVLNESDVRDMPESGAICAFETKSGICFDKACLYVAMARAINLNVRLIGGQAFDGEKYGGHAWNQVYLKDENIWINVDTTFYEAGNYFDSTLFKNHKEEDIAGEW